MKLTKLLLSLFLMLALGCQSTPEVVTPVAAADGCVILGHSDEWATAFCHLKTGVKSLHAKAMQSCVDKLNKKVAPLGECDKKRYIKEQACRKKIKLGHIENKMRSCLGNPDYNLKWIEN